MEQAKKNPWGSIKDTFNRIRILTLMQLKNNNKKKNKTTGRKVVSLVFFILVFVALVFLYNILIGLFANYLTLTFFKKHQFLIFFIAFMQVISIFACTIGMMQSLFLDKDNILLLAFPCRHSEVFVSKLLVYYISEFKKSIIVITPFLIAFGLNQNNSMMSDYNFNAGIYYSFTFILSFILPLIPVLVGSILSLPLSLLKRLMKNNSVIQIIVEAVIFISLFVLSIVFVNKALPSEIQVIRQYTTFVEGINNFLLKFSKYGLYIRTISNILLGERRGINILIFIATILVLVAGTILIIMPFFFKIASHSMEEARLKAHKVKENKKNHSIYFSFMKKDLLIEVRGLGELVNEYLMLLVMPIFIIILCGIYSRMKLDLTAPTWIRAFTAFIIFIQVLTCNQRASVSITREGGEFVLVKTAPNNTSIMVWSKLTILSITSTVFTILSFSLLSIGLRLTESKYLLSSFMGIFSEILPMCIVAITTNLGLILYGLGLDIKNPHLVEYASTGSIKENDNIKNLNMTSSLFSVILVLAFVVTNLGMKLGMLVPLIISLLVLILRFVLFKKYLYAFFDDIEL